MDNSQTLRLLLEQTAPELARKIGAQWWSGQYQIRGARTDKFRRYARGDHDSKMTDQQKKALRVKEGDTAKLSEFNDNYMRMVIDKEASRLETANMTTGTEQGDVWLADIKKRSKFDMLEGSTYRGALRDGDSYIIIDPVTLTWKKNKAYDGFDGVAVIYGDDDDIIWACKLWAETSGEEIPDSGIDEQLASISMHATVYMPGKIMRFSGTQGEMSASEKPMDLAISKIPIIPFVNQRDNDSMYGTSEIKDAIALQDILNRVMASTVMVAELNGFKVFIAVNANID